MYASTQTTIDLPLKAWTIESDPGQIWFGAGGRGAGRSVHAITVAEAQELVAELSREIALAEAEVRGVSA